MRIEFDPNNNIIKLCMMGMKEEASGEPEKARITFLKAWEDSINDFERFISAYNLALNEKGFSERLKWLETSLQCAIKLNDDCVKTALPSIYRNIAECYSGLGDLEDAEVNYELSNSFKLAPSDKGPFYHGTRADLQVGDLLLAGHNSNYNSDVKMNHIYFTSNLKGAGLAAGMAKGDGRERIYIVEPTGVFENDPNVTDKKFPGNLTRSYRSLEPLRIVGEEINWAKQTSEEINKRRDNATKNKGEIIN